MNSSQANTDKITNLTLVNWNIAGEIRNVNRVHFKSESATSTRSLYVIRHNIFILPFFFPRRATTVKRISLFLFAYIPKWDAWFRKYFKNTHIVNNQGLRLLIIFQNSIIFVTGQKRVQGSWFVSAKNRKRFGRPERLGVRYRTKSSSTLLHMPEVTLSRGSESVCPGERIQLVREPAPFPV